METVFFETIRVDAGTAPLLADHLDRFQQTWKALMPGPPPDLSWDEIIGQVIAANGLDTQCAAVKVLATRGSRAVTPWDHALVVSARPYIHRLNDVDGDGLRLGTYPHPRQTPWAAHKTLNYLYYLHAGHWARDNGFDEALILNPDGSISETNSASLLLVNHREVVQPLSPASLPGVMANVISRALGALGHVTITRPVFPDELLSARQVLATNALMGAVSVAAIDHHSRPVDVALCKALNDRVIPLWNG